jgi:hypothetical protein
MASAPEDKLADLPSAELVAYLSNSYLKANFEAVARILEARDRRDAKLSAELVAALADLDALIARGREATEVKAKLEAVRALFLSAFTTGLSLPRALSAIYAANL